MAKQTREKQRTKFWASVALDIEAPEAMRHAVTEVLEGFYETLYSGSRLTILDIGANVGAFSLWSNMRWPESEIYAYEPHPDTFATLVSNVGELDNVHCVCAAVYPSDAGMLPFFSRFAGDGEASLLPVAQRMFRRVAQRNLIEVSVLHPALLPEADIVKIDTEGAEVEILEAMDVRQVALIIVQYHYRADGERIKELLQPRFSLEYEDATEWRPLIAHSEYRPSLMNDCYGRMFFVNRGQTKLRRIAEEVDKRDDGLVAREDETASHNHEEFVFPDQNTATTPPGVHDKHHLKVSPAPASPSFSAPAPRLTAGYVYDLLRTMVGRDMKLRYKRSMLGIAWSLLNPLAQLLVFSFVFRFVFPLDVPNYTAFLFIGILAWAWFQGAVQQATGAIVENGPLIGFPGFPVAVLPVVTVSSHLLHFLLALPIVLLFVLASGLSLGVEVLLLPFVILVQFVLCLSLAFLVATLQVFFRDTEHLLGIALMLGFFLTPIFYDLASIPESYRPFFRLNPMVVLIEAYRDILVNGVWPEVGALIMLGIVSALVLAFSYRLFSRASYRFVEQI